VSLQCFDTDGWVAGKTSGPKNLVPLIPRGSLLDKVEDIRGNWLTQIHPENAVKQNYQYY